MTATATHRIERVRHQPRFRMLEVQRVALLAPSMVRITFGGDLGGFHSAAYDDHVKLFFPAPGEGRIPVPEITPEGTRFAEGSKPAARDFTPRRHDAAARELDVDFVLHDAGPATEWAARAEPGHVVGVGGPRASFVVSDTFDWYLLASDETGIPAAARRLEELRPGVPAFVFIEVENKDEEIVLESRADVSVIFAHRNGAPAPGFGGLSQALAKLDLPAGEGYTWIACDSAKAKRLRADLLARHTLNPKWVKAAGYWKPGTIATHDRFED